MTVVGRIRDRGDGTIERQWPGTYFETGFDARQAYFGVGPGTVSLRISVDGKPPVALVRPAPGIYRVSGLGKRRHLLRVDVASESQAGPTIFGGFYADPGVRAVPVARRRRAIEFIGDSLTVGYGNTSPVRRCTADEVWQTTDASRGIAALTAARYGADYQVNAISGRGVVRSYNGAAVDALPAVYPFASFDKAEAVRTRDWRPQVIVIGLGTNDFSTPLHAGERWPTRDALRADFENSFVRFVRRLRADHPSAHILLWSTDVGNGELKAEVARVADRLEQSGDQRVGFLSVPGLSFSACSSHPGLTDDRAIADAIAGYLDGLPGTWARFRGDRKRIRR